MPGRELARFEQPARWWLRRDPLPVNATGKILRREIRAQWLARGSAVTSRTCAVRPPAPALSSSPNAPHRPGSPAGRRILPGGNDARHLSPAGQFLLGQRTAASRCWTPRWGICCGPPPPQVPGRLALVEGSAGPATRRPGPTPSCSRSRSGPPGPCWRRFAPGERIAVWAPNCPEWMLLAARRQPGQAWSWSRSTRRCGRGSSGMCWPSPRPPGSSSPAEYRRLRHGRRRRAASAATCPDLREAIALE